MMKLLLRLTAAAATLAASLALSQSLPVVMGEPALAPKMQPVAKLRLQPAAAVSPRGVRVQTQLSPIADAELEAVRNANRRGSNAPKRLAIGVNRADDGASLPRAGDLRWTVVDGGQATQASVTSPQAAALRLKIDLASAPTNLEMVFFGSAAPDRLVGPMRAADIADRMAPWWSPVTEGDTQTVEFFVPDSAQGPMQPIRFAGVSHLFAGPASKFEKRVQDIGDSGDCNVDVPCSALAGSGTFRNTAESVAKMVFTDGFFTSMCTGTLLNDTDAATQIPWFFGANHCFENEELPLRTPSEIQAVASTLNTYWHFEATSCRSEAAAAFSQLAGGATLIYNNAAADVLFLRLNSPPPAGAFYNGWDPNPVAAGTPVVTIHHPLGDLKKVSQGTVLNFSTPPVIVSGGSFIQTRWSSGTTEGGSSGAGVFTASGSQYLLRGGLWGGNALCTNLNGTDNYSRFDLVYPALALYLSPTASPTTDYTDLWWNANESGWGLKLIQHASRNIFGAWYTYGLDRKRTWFVIPGGSWTSTNVFRGDIYATTGPAQTGVFDPNRVTRTLVGTATLTFFDANNGMFDFSINGTTGSKVITRQPF